MTGVSEAVLMRRPSARMSEGALTFLERVPLDLALAAQQHAAYREAVVSAGLTLIDLPALDDFPDSTFVEDVLLAFPECFVLCRPGVASRLREPDFVASALPNDRPIYRIEAPGTIDGGDVLRIEREIFVGLSSRTNEAAVGALSRIVNPFGYSIVPLAVTGSLHLKTAVTAPRANILVANPKWVDLSPFGSRQVVDVDTLEPFAGNTLRLGDVLYAQTAHTQTTARLLDVGLEVSSLDISEFAKIEAGLTCMSVIFPPVV